MNYGAQFLKDVAKHRINVLRDDGIYRHIQFREPGTYCMGFDLVTWPGYLCYSGDMGEFVFSRIADMFEFFRMTPKERESGLHINPGYWGEKCRAADTSGHGIKEYSAERFREAITRRLDDMEADDELRQEVKDEVLSRADDGMHQAIYAAMDFVHKGHHVFDDMWESDPTEYTRRFLWCCYALVWGISRYDDAKQAQRSAVA